MLLYEKLVKQYIKDFETAYTRNGRYLDEKGEAKYRAAAVDFEDANGVTGIAGRHKMPEGKKHSRMEYELRRDFQKYALARVCLMKDKKDKPEKTAAAKHIFAQSSKAKPALDRRLKTLVSLNPELEKLEINKKDFFEVYHTLIGVTSQYNVDDINAFIKDKRPGNSRSGEIGERKDFLSEKYGVRFGWTPCFRTLEKIENRLEAKRLFEAVKTAKKRKTR